jgi:hypothetical protein
MSLFHAGPTNKTAGNTDPFGTSHIASCCRTGNANTEEKLA